MATDNSSTLVRRSTKRSSHENRFTELKNAIHYAAVFRDKDGAIKATGSESFKDTHSWFTQDLRKRFQDFLCNGSGQPTQLHSDRPAKRYRASVDDSDKQKAAVEVLPDYSNTQQVTAHYSQAFSRLLRINCGAIGQAWVELLEPNKQRKRPYSKGDDVKPKWWPDGVPHKSPHHLCTDDCVTLLIHILRMSGKGKITCAKLKEEGVIAIRRNEEKAKTQGDHATGPPDEELDCGLIKVSGSESNEGRDRSTVGSPEDQTEEKSSPAFPPSSYLSISEAAANLMYYRGSPGDQIEKIPPSSPSVKSSRGSTPTTYTSTSEALANAMWDRGSQYQTPYPLAQSISYRAPFSITEAPPTGAHMHEQQLGRGRLSWPYLNNPSSEHTMHCHQSMQPIYIAYHHSCHYFPMAQDNGFGLVDSTAPSPSSSQQTLPSNPASYSHATSYGFPHQSWPVENNNDNNNWDTLQYWNH